MFNFYLRYERLARSLMKEKKGVDVCANVDLYSGLAYTMLNIPKDLYTPLFVCSRIVGWLAHNIENKLYDGRIMRPATRYVGELYEYKKWRIEKMKTITVFKGDGIGPEITDAVLDILKAAKAPLDYEIFQVGLPLYEECGELVSPGSLCFFRKKQDPAEITDHDTGRFRIQIDQCFAA